MLPTIELLAAELAAGRITAVELVSAALARITDAAGEGGRCFVRIDADGALAAARASDELRAAGLARSPLDGLPLSVKDNFDLRGQPTTAGSRLLQDAAPATTDAPAIARLRAAGAVIVGRTNMSEFAYSGLGLNPHYGTPRNPWDRSQGRIPGGSSSGAAVSVSDRMAVAAVGSDTGGSVRVPAALCGLVGFKPTARRVPLEGMLPLASMLDAVGPIGVSVRCCAIVEAAMAGAAVPPPPPFPLAGLRLALPVNVVLEQLDGRVSVAFDAACARLEAAGVRISRIELPELGDKRVLPALGTFCGAEAWAWHRAHIARTPDAYDPRVLLAISVGDDIAAADLLELMAVRKRWIAAVEARIAPFDAVLMPTVPTVAPLIDSLADDDSAYFRANGLMLRNTALINFLDGCALSLPCQPAGEAPVGLMLAASAGNDQHLLALGQSVETLLQSGS